MAIRTRLTEALGIAAPILSAPMALSAGGKLAAAVSASGGLGMLGAGYGDRAWIEREFAAAGRTRIGCGFITWMLATQPEALDVALAHSPAALLLSFGDPTPFAGRIHDAGAILICQVQTVAHARTALDCGASILVAQGAEAGGHGALRATMTLVPELADVLARESPRTLLVAAGGIGDGRGLAASLMLGADGVMIGTRLWTSPESLAHPNHQRAVIDAEGDDTVRQTAADLAAGVDWPAEFTGRVLRNAFVERWHGREREHRAAADAERASYRAARAAGRSDEIGVYAGEVVGLIHERLPAGEVIAQVVSGAEALLREGAGSFLA
ncbi:MAG TPA: nitronate monooxygenase [Caulobacteraceae bacterium]